MIADMKDWIQNRADDLATELHNKEFYDLPSNLQDTVYQQAMEDWTDYYADQIDHIYEREKERQLLG